MISLLIPTYNEQETIGLLIDRIRAHLSGIKHEIIVVDDNSTDGTKEIVKAKALEIRKGTRRNTSTKEIILLEHEERTFGDVSPALKIGQGDIIVRLDADLEHDPADLPKMIKPIQDREADLVLGKRPQFSRKMEYFLKWWYKPPVEDLFTGYVAFSRRLLPYAQQLGATPLYWELPLYAMKRGFRIKEVEVNYVRRKGKPRLGGEIRGGILAWRLFRRCRKKVGKLTEK